MASRKSSNFRKQFNRKLYLVSLILMCFLTVSFSFTSSIASAGGVTFITHGFKGDMGWVNDLSDKIIARNGGSTTIAKYTVKLTGNGFTFISENSVEFGSAANTTGQAVVMIDWVEYSVTSFGYGAPTKKIAQLVVDLLRAYSNTTRNLLASPIHLIGHSRGGSLVAAMADKMGDYGYWVDQITFLDPHPTTNAGDDDDWGEDEMTVPKNVIFADNYYRYEFYSEGTTGGEPDGEHVIGALNVRLDEGYLESIDGYGFPSYEHSKVHAWYRGTIPSSNPPYTIETNDFQITSDWYAAGVYEDIAWPRGTIGYAFSLAANGGVNRPYEGLHSGINGSGQVRNFEPTETATAINNVGYLSLRTTDVIAGDTIEADYRYQSWTTDFGVEFYLDTNRNPHDGYLNTMRLGLDFHGVSNGMEGVSTPATLTVQNSTPVDTYYVFIKSTGANGSRYYYAPMQLSVNNSSVAPAPDVETVIKTAKEDTYVVESYPTNNFNSSPTFLVQSATVDYYGLIKFDLSTIPNGSVIRDVELKLSCSYETGSLKQINFRKSNSSWTESSVTWNTKPPIGSTIFWYDVTGLGIQSIANSALTNLVEDWVNGTEDNYGIYLIGGNVGDGFTFSSSEDSFPYRPKLTINYTKPPPPDLIITNLYPVPSPSFDQFLVGQRVDWKATVKNDGSGPADSSRVGCYLGTSPTDFSHRINSYSISALNSKEFEIDYDDYQFATSDVGQRYLICKADYGEDVEERFEKNNTKFYGPFNVVLPNSNTYYLDKDSDGYGDSNTSIKDSTQPLGYVMDNTDCNDYDSSIHPAAKEIRGDGIDQDCDGSDIANLNISYMDYDNDGYGDPDKSIESDTQQSGYVTDNTDCNDSDSTIYPGATEICGDGIDQDCNGSDNICVTQTQVAELYVATFNRAPDSAGLAYWVESVLTIEQIAQSFFDQPETKLLYPAGNTDTEFVTSIYQNLFNRAPDAAGLAYWVDALGSGALTRPVMIQALKNGSLSTDAEIIANKAEVGLYYASMGLENNNFSLSDITDDPTTVEAAKIAVDDLLADPSDSIVTNFEDYSLNTWPSPDLIKDANASSDSSNNLIVSDPINNGNQVLKLFGALGSCWGSLAYKQYSFSDDFYIEVKVYNGPEDLSGCHPDRADIGLRQGVSWSNPGRTLIIFKGNGDIIAGDSTTVLQGYQTEQWYDIKIHYRRVNNNLMLGYWIDDTYIGQIQMTISDLSQELTMDHVDLTAQEGSVYFDNINVYPESALSDTEIYDNDFDKDGKRILNPILSNPIR